MVKESFLAQFYGKSQNYTDIPNKWYKEYNVKKGLRNEDGTGVRIGLTRVADVVGYEETDGGIKAIPGRLLYRGVDVLDLVKGKKESHFGYEETCFLLLFGYLPKKAELEKFCNVVRHCYTIPDEFVEMNLLRLPGKNLMNSFRTRSLPCIITMTIRTILMYTRPWSRVLTCWQSCPPLPATRIRARCIIMTGKACSSIMQIRNIPLPRIS